MLPADRGRVVLHWFSGTKAEAQRAAAMGCYFSVNQAMLEKPKGQELIRSLPTDRLLTETDGPFIEQEGRPVGPGEVQPALRKLSTALAIPLDDIRELVVSNLAQLMA
jgi:TatD DNase family protein